jgi:glutamine amidotransferase
VCRHLGYLGPPRPVRELLFDAPHALVHQGRAPREMVVAKDNPDGWGVAWWPPLADAPGHYRTTTVMWEDTAFADGDDETVAALAAVRKASPNTTLDAVNNAPFVARSRLGWLAFSLNGHAFHASCEARVRAALPRGAALAGDTDSEVLFALVRERIDAGAGATEAIAAVHRIIDPGPEVHVNLLLVLPELMVATTWQHSLHVRSGHGSTTVASEPLDADPGWSRVADASLLVADADHVQLTSLEGTPHA